MGLFYLVYLGGLGAQASYLPLALSDRGMTLGEVSAVLMIPAVMRMIVPAAWGYMADRLGQGKGLLVLACWGMALTYLPILWGGFAFTAVMLGLYSFFRLPIGTLADALTFQRVATTGESFGSIRRWGTVGYVVVVLISGYIAQAVSAAFAVSLGVVLMVATARMSHALPSPPAGERRGLGGALKKLVSERRFLLFLLAVMLHTIGQAAYDSLFPLHLSGLGVDRSLIGWAVALGATVEVGVMSASGWLLRRVSAERLCVVASLVAAARWALNGALTDVTALIAVQALHGVTFGAWYIAAATLADRQAPERLRASAQGLLTVASFGVGGVIAMTLGAFASSTAALFQVCALLALGAAVIMAAIAPRPVPSP
jgi:MFS transporter, PPP family, 3-phenylpropionic acid transporter